jgi:hypothetical protein
MKEQSNRQVALKVKDKYMRTRVDDMSVNDAFAYDLLFAVHLTRDKIDSFQMTEFNVPTKYIHVEEFAYILLFLIPVQVALWNL